MKKNVLSMIVVLMMISALPSYANTSDAISPAETAANTARAAILIERLEELKEVDKSSLSHAEKRTMRKEVKSINKELKTMGSSGVYLSVGAVIIILLLLILLL